ncbi:MAG: type II toxin-antitoxin system VapB family antitoxin [bacterium]|nr:type II toxin-antitoxin system VapB family antitoxin [bacterium]MDE0501618.1 type II toxin-antitoxin system VapB family antitoxin [bacterium]
MTKRLIDIDDDLLDQARTLTGAKTMRETVNTSLREVINAELRRQHLVRLVTGEGTDIADDEVMAGAWR